MIYSDLSTIGKIAYSRYKAGTITSAQIAELVSAGKLTSDEKLFIEGVI